MSNLRAQLKLKRMSSLRAQLKLKRRSNQGSKNVCKYEESLICERPCISRAGILPVLSQYFLTSSPMVIPQKVFCP